MKDIVQQGLPSSEISIAWKVVAREHVGFGAFCPAIHMDTSKFRPFWSMNNG